MAWSDLTFTGCTVLTAGQMTQLQANLAALAHGDAGAPALSLNSFMWTGQASGAALDVSSRGTFRQVAISDIASIANLNVAGVLAFTNMGVTGQGSFGSVNVSSGYQVRGSWGRLLVQEVVAKKYSTQSNCTAVYSTYLVGSMTPLYSDSEIRVRAEVAAYCIGGNVGDDIRINLCRAPNGTPVVLTHSGGNEDVVTAGAANIIVAGGVSMTAVESSLTGPLQYGVRFRLVNASASQGQLRNSRIVIQEWL